ncbi:MAG: hypothetical protein JWN46_2437 [Acidimicrobiales bacterium]|nr:hypothetical protein [Acidimicrobiales bacterium]
MAANNVKSEGVRAAEAVEAEATGLADAALDELAVATAELVRGETETLVRAALAQYASRVERMSTDELRTLRTSVDDALARLDETTVAILRKKAPHLNRGGPGFPLAQGATLASGLVAEAFRPIGQVLADAELVGPGSRVWDLVRASGRPEVIALTRLPELAPPVQAALAQYGSRCADLQAAIDVVTAAEMKAREAAAISRWEDL